MSEAKDFTIGAAASITTGILLCDNFGEVHELMEWLAGFPIWTHQIPRLSNELRALALVQHPGLPTKETIGEVNRDNNWPTILADIERRLGPKLAFKKGDGNLAERRNPIEEAVELMGKGRVIAVRH